MAIDGSFCLQSSLRRFLDRCPKLQFFPQFDSLAEKGELVTEEEVVNKLVGVFLHPSYTIPLMGCFRPIARNFVDKAVALLRLVPNLRSSTKDTALEDDFDRVFDEVVDVIEFYSQRGKGLDLHELACLAFCRALDMAPFLLSSLLSYFDFAPSPFERFSTKHVTVETHKLHVARISYRFLLMEPEIFSKLWDWSCFLDFVIEPQKPDLIWCGVQILRVVLKLGYRGTESLNIGAEETFACLLRWEEFCQDTSLEKAGWYIEPIVGNVSASPDRSMDFDQESYLKSFGFNYQGVSSPKLHELQRPFRNQRLATSDALAYWKERISVSGDIQGDDIDEQVEMEDDNADEYGYVNEFEKGTAQALGPASLEQVDRNVDADKLDKECLAGEKDVELQYEKKKPEINSVSNSSLIPKNETRDQVNVSAIEKSQDEGLVKPNASESIDPENQPKDLVSIRRSYISENTDKLSQLSVHDNDLGKGQDPCDVPDDVKNNATALWRRYELSTTKLSLELAEQLRLVMEPTVASKLQGDYRTGKRINMKKVIPYIASYYRKDKIWLRRTRPNKRDYQVVIAVDDSHSMSERCCGDVAIESLVTVCRAISQLEMGSLAVVSYGTKGNIKLLHDFDRPFTGEAGVKMISNLTFKQENTIADEPVVDLLKFLTNKLDSAVVKARLPSGRSPLQQLVLIIADGRFHEKEHLKRYVRDVSADRHLQGKSTAFLLLDNSQESIMDLMEASFEGGNMKFSKYLDSFPFPYYIILRNIEALPRTLANLLRQHGKLHASIRRTLMYKFETDLKEGVVYSIKTVGVVANIGSYRTTRHPYKLNFKFETDFKMLKDDVVLLNIFSFTPLSEVFSNGYDTDYLCDVMGILTAVGVEKELEKNGIKTKMNIIDMDVNGYRFKCTLFGSYVDELNSFLSSGEVDNVAVAILFAKVKSFQGKHVLQNTMHCTKLIFNCEDPHDVVQVL